MARIMSLIGGAFSALSTAFVLAALLAVSMLGGEGVAARPAAGIRDLLESFVSSGSGAPPYAAPVTGTLATKAGSATATLTARTGAVRPGDQVTGNANLPSGTVVLSVSGATLALSAAASATGSASSRFGIRRQGTGVTITATTIGAANVYVGAAAGGRGTWLNRLASGSDYASVAPLMVLAPPGGVGAAAWLAARTSDVSQSPFPVDEAFLWADHDASPWPTWVRYTESDLTSQLTVDLTTTAGSMEATVPAGTPVVARMRAAGPNLRSGTIVSAVDGTTLTLSEAASATGTAATTFGTAGYHIGEESSIYSLWDYRSTDPYAFNPVGGTRNIRLDCGKGTTFQQMGAPRRCSAALEIVDNAARYGKGIMFGRDALDTAEHGLGQAMVMAPMQALVWYQGAGTPGWSIYQDTMTGAKGAQYQLHLGQGFAQVNAAFIASTYYETLSTPASSSAACTPGQFTDDANYHYVCVTTNTWKRAALTSW